MHRSHAVATHVMGEEGAGPLAANDVVLRIVRGGREGSGSKAFPGTGSVPRRSRRDDTPERGGVVQQPVQQRAPNGGESKRTATDIACRRPALIGHSRIMANPPNVTGGNGRLDVPGQAVGDTAGQPLQ